MWEVDWSVGKSRRRWEEEEQRACDAHGITAAQRPRTVRCRPIALEVFFFVLLSSYYNGILSCAYHPFERTHVQHWGGIRVGVARAKLATGALASSSLTQGD